MTKNSIKVANKNWILIILDYLSGAFASLVPVLAGSGMIKALLAILDMFSWWDAQSATALVLTAASNAIFYFFPIFIGLAAAKYLDVNPFVVAVIGAALLEPNFTALIENGSDLDFVGVPLLVIDYSSTVFPMLVATAVYAPLERLLKKYTPESIQLFFVPMMSILIMVPLSTLAFGPIAQGMSDGIVWLISKLLDFSAVLTGVVYAVAWPFMVMVGVQWGIIPISMANAASTAGDPLMPMASAPIFAQLGIALAITVKYRKNKYLYSIALPATISGSLAGITEPIVYGLIFTYRKLVPIMVIASAIGGALVGFLEVRMIAFAFTSVLTIPTNSPIELYLIAMAVSFTVAFVLTFVVGIGDDLPDEAEIEEVV